jgi:hypothetical protein
MVIFIYFIPPRTGYAQFIMLMDEQHHRYGLFPVERKEGRTAVESMIGSWLI